MIGFRRLSTTLALLLVVSTARTEATSYVMVPDEALVDSAAVIAQATVEGVEPAPIPGPPATDYFFQIERLLKGHATGSTIVVRVPGGIGPDGVGLRIWGVPEFRERERVLLFLAPRSDGTYGILQLMLGAFFEVESGGQRVAVRALSEALALPTTDGGRTPAASEPLRDFGGFVNWITDRTGGLKRPIDYYVDPALGHLRPARESGPLLEDRCTQLNFRWFELDRGDAVKWSFDSRDLNRSGTGRRAFFRARRLWSRESEGAVAFQNGGSRDGGRGLQGHDGINLLLFDDPHELIAGSFSCGNGGVLALTGVWFENGRGQSCEHVGAGRKANFRAKEYLEIVGADILTNDGAACLLADDLSMATRILAHELGHSLGLSHSTDRDALMSGVLTDGGEKEPLAASDLESISGLYSAARER